MFKNWIHLEISESWDAEGNKNKWRVVASPYVFLGFPSGSAVKNPAMQETRVWSLGWKDLLEEEMATDSSILAWRIPWTEEPGGYSPWGRRVGHDCCDWAHTHRYIYTYIHGWSSCIVTPPPSLAPSGSCSFPPSQELERSHYGK